MAKTTNYQKMLELIPGPAFTVTDNTITLCNQNALACMIEPGTNIAGTLTTGQDEYARFQEACLYTTMLLGETLWGATIVRLEGLDIFRLDQDGLSPELKAMAMLGTELRCAVGNLTLVTNQMYAYVEDKDLAAAANHELHKVLRILNNVSNTARYMEDRSQYQQERNVCSVMREFLYESAELLARADIKLNVSLPTREIYTMLDWPMLRQAVYGLLDNAAKYTEPGGTIDAVLSKTGGMLRLSVTDHGPGIAEGVRDSMFSRFTRQPGIDDVRSGLGLGLVLVRSAAIAHGGTVLVDTPPEGGTRVTLTMAMRQPRHFKLHSQRNILIPSPDDALVMLSNVLPRELYTPEED